MLRLSPQGRVSSDMCFFPCLFPSFSFIIIFVYQSCHKNNVLSRKDESFFNNRGQKIVTAYDRRINKTNKIRHKDKWNETRNVNLYSSNIMFLIKGCFFSVDEVKSNKWSARFLSPWIRQWEMSPCYFLPVLRVVTVLFFKCIDTILRHFRKLEHAVIFS